MTLKRKATVGVFWVSISTAANNFFNLLIKYVLARMLFPADFGLWAMAAMAIDFLGMFREMGFSSALIYRKGDMRKSADTTFTVLLVIDGVLFSIAFFGAPFVALFFRTPSVTPILRALAFVILLSALGEVQLALLAKNLAFRERLLPDLVPTMAYGIVAVTLALMGLGVWSLVIAKIVDQALTSLLCWVVVPWWRPRLRFDRQEAKELFDYGKHIFGSGILVWLITNLDNMFVGRVLGDEPLGVYKFSYDQANIPATQISRVIGQVLFPAYSTIRDDIQALRDAFFKALRYVSLVAIPVSVGMIVFARPFIMTLYGEKWAAAILPLQILGVYGLLRAVAVNMGSVFKAGGKPQWLTAIAFARLAVMALFLYPAARYFGIVGVSWFSTCVAIADFAVSVALTNRIVRGTLGDYMKALGAALGFSLLSALVAMWAYMHISGGHGFIALMVAGMLMVTLYGVLLLIFEADLRHMIVGLRTELEQAGRKWMGNGG